MIFEKLVDAPSSPNLFKIYEIESEKEVALRTTSLLNQSQG